MNNRDERSFGFLVNLLYICIVDQAQDIPILNVGLHVKL